MNTLLSFWGSKLAEAVSSVWSPNSDPRSTDLLTSSLTSKWPTRQRETSTGVVGIKLSSQDPVH